MSIIVQLCEQSCPIHPDLVCCEETGHEMPHRTVLVGARPGEPKDRIVIEWRPARDEERWSDGSVLPSKAEAMVSPKQPDSKPKREEG